MNNAMGQSNQAGNQGGAQDAAQAGVPCPQCGHQNAPGAKFCMECGTKQGPATCANCQAELTPGAKFCNECGQKV
jgi:membrane protease subunit (stomatin/prohibitin family)